ncbi:primosomal protein N' [Vulcanibacillus modesticaldus]|uniref:Replication restart protein PriA n=2 Tax=Vulcanibacillus modesticaldus TaxID=337097 RepID=A0A1D2YTU6_9BACI|nr:primosomal protein N' [Vulcanibacillus modesticaldus]
MRHHGFDYLVPDSLLPTLKKGCRVIVPLGSRVTQGFVIEIKSTTRVKNVKPIKENLDIIPSLTEELIQLGSWMSNYYSSHLFRVLQMLIPTALKTKMEQYILVNDEIEKDNISLKELEIIEWVAKNQPIKQSILIDHFSNEKHLIQQMLQFGLLELKRDFVDKGTSKKISFLKLKLSNEHLLLEIAELSKQARKQREVLEYFLFNQINEVSLSTLMSKLNINRSTIQSLVKKGYLEVIKKETARDPYKDRNFQDKRVTLTVEQEQVLRKIVSSFNGEEIKPFLLHGVTGSGKTEIYLQSIEEVLKEGKDSIVLVPEISLTSQMVERFKGRFGSLVAVIHSRLSQGEKLDEWRRIQRGDAKIIIGARSAIFAPVRNLGLIIIDEEHESSYKQEENPKYHVREVAKWRASYHNAVLVLGSATPSMESYFNAQNNQYYLLELPNRILGRKMPKIELVDMRDELRVGNRSMFSQTLQEKIDDRLNKQEQIVLFLNRRGYSTFVMCRSCGYVMKCPHCEISLTYHHTNRVLRCHYCGYTVSDPQNCPECGSKHIRYFGTGTQKVEEELVKRFPGVRVIRMDVDTTSKKGAHDKLLASFRKHEADILLGTQMIAKGLDFEKVTLVGVIAADTLLRLPDFRAAERTFQLLTQVSGRAGRHHLSGDVVIQTYTPEHYSIQYASNHDFQSFYKQELKQRKMMDYPPFRKLIVVHFSHQQLPNVMKASQLFVKELNRLVSRDVEILGPVTSPISRIKDRNRFQCMIKYNDESSTLNKVNQTISLLIEGLKDRNLLISVDVDPYVLM